MNSVRYVFNLETKEVVQEIEYDELGNQLKNTNPGFQPLGYAGGLFDSDTKLIRFGARDYDPTIGRWTTKDPIGFAGGDTNLYAYVNGDPMSYVDPDGKIALSTILAIAAIPTLGYLGYKVNEYRSFEKECAARPVECAKFKAYEMIKKEVEKNERLFPGECRPPNGPMPAAPFERRRRKV